MFTVSQSVQALDSAARLFSLLMAEKHIPKDLRAAAADSAIDLHLLSEQIAQVDKKQTKEEVSG